MSCFSGRAQHCMSLHPNVVHICMTKTTTSCVKISRTRIPSAPLQAQFSVKSPDPAQLAPVPGFVTFASINALAAGEGRAGNNAVFEVTEEAVRFTPRASCDSRALQASRRARRSPRQRELSGQQQRAETQCQRETVSGRKQGRSARFKQREPERFSPLPPRLPERHTFCK